MNLGFNITRFFQNVNDVLEMFPFIHNLLVIIEKTERKTGEIIRL
jgi:hypothetical protein